MKKRQRERDIGERLEGNRPVPKYVAYVAIIRCLFTTLPAQPKMAFYTLSISEIVSLVGSKNRVPCFSQGDIFMEVSSMSL
eukprot:6213255-Pleurochrysis_carterae.AAC.3